MKTGKRLLALLLALLLLFSLLPVSAAADADDPAPDDPDGYLLEASGPEDGDGGESAGCSHDYEEAVTEATCSAGGYTTHICRLCGDTFTDGFTDPDPNNHDYEVTVTAPTCSAQGYTTHTCRYCGDSFTDGYTDPDPDNHDYEVTVTAPSCSAQGYTTHTCRYCGDSFTDSYTDPDPDNHSPKEVGEIPAAGSEPGRRAGVVCAACGAVLSGCEEIPKLEPKPEEPEDPQGSATALRITSQPENAPIADGAAAFSVEAAAETEALAYQWQRLDGSVKYESEEDREAAWTALDGETGSTLRLAGLSGFEELEAAAPLLYRCVVTAGEASATTDEVGLLLTERDLKPTVITGFAALSETGPEWEHKPTLARLLRSLPEALDVSLGGTAFFTEDAEGGALLLAVRGASSQTLPVAWSCVQDYDEELEYFDFVPSAEGYTLAEGLRAPDIRVRVGEVYTGALSGVIPGWPSDVPIVGAGGRKRGMSNEKYNAYELGLLPPIRDQGSEGACWAFAVLGAIETDMISGGLADPDSIGDGLSESYLSYYLSHDPAADTFRNGPLDDRRTFSGNYLDHGGNNYVAEIILQNGVGPVWESPGDYSSDYTPDGNEARAAQLTGAYFINADDSAGIKAAIRAHGGVYCSIYFSTAYYSSIYNSYYSTCSALNHGVMLVGWDDSFPRTNFRQTGGKLPESNGAWLVRNSWGGNGEDAEDDYGAAGYFWMSYEDVGFLNGSVGAFDVEPDVYQYCYAYDSLPFPEGTEHLAADVPMSLRFTAVGDESVTAVGFQADSANLHGTVTVSCGEESSETDVWTGFSGFYLFTLSQPVNAPEGAEITVTLCFDTEAGIDFERSGSTAFGAVTFYAQQDGPGCTVGSGETAVTRSYDPRIKLYTVDGTAASGSTTEAACVLLSGDGLVPVYEENSTVIKGYTLALVSGESEQLTASVLPEDADNRAVAWSSSDPDVARVDDGLVMGAAPGEAVITAAARNGKSVSCTVTVTGVAVDSVRLTGSFTQEDGQKVYVLTADSLSDIRNRADFDLTSVPSYFNYQVLPENASNKRVVWASSNPAVYEVDAESGVGRFLGNGEALLTVSSVDSSHGVKSDSVLIRVALDTYTVSYDANGGENAPASQPKCQFIPITLSGDMPTRLGYDFLGWAASAGAKQAQYPPGARFTVNASVTLYAVWRAHSYTVSFDANGGTGSMRAQSMTYGTAAALTANAFTWANHIFLGWSTDPEAASPTWSNKQKVSSLTPEDGGQIRLYAVWIKHRYRIVFNANGGSGDMSEDGGFCEYDGTYTLPPCAFTRAGYDFRGWATSAKGKVKYQDGQQIAGLSTVNGKLITLYAVWSARRYSIRFDGNGATGGSVKAMDGLSCGTKYTLRANAYKRTGYTFTGWNTEPDGSGAAFKDRAKRSNFTTQAETLTLYAQWTLTNYSIRYKNVAASDGNTNPGSYTIADAFALTEISRPGCTFGGWYTDAGFKKPVSAITAGRTGNLTLYARWAGKANPYRIVFNANGGRGSMKSLAASCGKKTSLTANAFKRTGYTFTGWNTEADGSGAAYGNKAKVLNLTEEANGTVTLYAQWAYTPYKITYKNVTGYDGNPNPRTYTMADSFALEPASREDRPFLGWYTDAKFKKPIESVAAGRTGDLTLYARWGGSTAKYTIAFNGNGASSGKMNRLTNRSYDVAYKLPANAFKRTGYRFVGWSLEAGAAVPAFSNRAKAANLSAVNGSVVTLYAVWSPVEYTITYRNVVGSNVPEKGSYTILEDYELPTPEKAGAVFLGWYTTSGFKEGTKVTGVTRGSTGNKVFYAKWMMISQG